MLTIPQLTEKMIAFSAGNTADIHHFLCVWAYAKTIGEAEGLDEKTLFLLEATAIIHDISCPLCREKYGNTDGKHQEAESPRLVRDFLADSGFDAELIDRISYLIAHHHTMTGIDGGKGLGKRSRGTFSGKRGENGLRQTAVAIYIS